MHQNHLILSILSFNAFISVCLMLALSKIDYVDMRSFITYLIYFANGLGVLSIILIVAGKKKLATIPLYINALIFIPMGIVLFFIANKLLSHTESELVSRLASQKLDLNLSSPQIFAAGKLKKMFLISLIGGILLLTIGTLLYSSSGISMQFGFGILLLFNAFMLHRHIENGKSVIMYNNFMLIQVSPFMPKIYIAYHEITNIIDVKDGFKIEYTNSLTLKKDSFVFNLLSMKVEDLEEIKQNLNKVSNNELSAAPANFTIHY